MTTTRSQDVWRFRACCALALALLVCAYANSLDNAFHFDDTHVVENNLYLRNLRNIPLFFRDASTFSSVPTNATYRPLVTTSLAIDYWLGGGLGVRQFHRSQLALLAALAVMVFFLFKRLLDDALAHWWNAYAALVATAVFALHTTNTETLNLMHARSEILSVMGVVGAFLVYLYLPSSRRTYAYLVPLVIGVTAKNQAVVFAPIFLVYLVLFEQRLSVSDVFARRSRPAVWAAIRKGLPAIVLGIGLLAWVESMNAAGANYGGGDRLDYLKTEFFVWLHYGRLFVLPMGLTADTDWTLIRHWYDTRVLAGVLFVVLLGRIVWTTSNAQAWRPVAFGLAWFALALLPASSVVPLAEVSNEHRMFFPDVGLSLAAVWGGAMLVERWSMANPRRRPMLWRIATTLALVTIVGNAVGTFERNRAWRSEESLWRDVTEKSPANGRGLMNYGLTQMAQGKYAEARQLFEQARVYTPNYGLLEINLGIVTNRLGDPDAAESHFRRALELQPDEPAAHSFYAEWLVERGRLPEAIDHLQRSVRLSPADLSSRHQLMTTYAAAGRAEELKALVAETLALVPGDLEARQHVDDRGEAVLAPANALADSAATTPEGLLNASLRQYQAGDFQVSIDTARKALALKPDFAEAYNNIAAGFASLKRWDEAIQAAHEALRLKPDYPLAQNNLRWAEGEKQKADR